MAGSNIGMMDSAYFVGRHEILNWLNDTLKTNLVKVEETASGAVACQLMDMIYPGSVPMSKVRWDAKSEYEFIQNYKILQSVFNKKSIEKHIDVQKLIRAKYQDNLEFMQWFKRFFDLNYHGNVEEYDAIERRRKGKGTEAAPFLQSSRANSNKTKASGASGGASRRPGVAPGARKSAGVSTGNVSGRPSAGRPARERSVGAAQANAATERKITELTEQLEEFKGSVEGLERERDFYFGKLRDVEIFLQSYEGGESDLKQNILKILYATTEDFVQVDENGNELPSTDETNLVDDAAKLDITQGNDEQHPEEALPADSQQVYQ